MNDDHDIQYPSIGFPLLSTLNAQPRSLFPPFLSFPRLKQIEVMMKSVSVVPFLPTP